MGSPFAIERVDHYSAGSFGSNTSLGESLRLTVDGVINSITIMPRISVLETGESLDLLFQVAPLFNRSDGSPMGPPAWTNVKSDGTSTTILNQFYPLASCVDLAVNGDFGEDLYFSEYRRSRGLPDETLVFGFSILSLNYTPVPDKASSACLLGIGIFGIVCVGWKRGSSARS